MEHTITTARSVYDPPSTPNSPHYEKQAAQREEQRKLARLQNQHRNVQRRQRHTEDAHADAQHKADDALQARQLRAAALLCVLEPAVRLHRFALAEQILDGGHLQAGHFHHVQLEGAAAGVGFLLVALQQQVLVEIILEIGHNARQTAGSNWQREAGAVELQFCTVFGVADYAESEWDRAKGW